MSDYISILQNAIRLLHSCGSRHLSTAAVTEQFQGKTIWDGEVEVFELIGHPQAKRCYAWVYDGDDGKQHLTAVLELPPVDSPQTAVQAAIVKQVRDEGKET
jgi:hypothetical protein